MTRTDWIKHHQDHFRNTRVLVTGGAGFIGSHIAHALVELGAHVVVIDDLCGGDIANLATLDTDQLTFINASIREASALKLAVEGCRYVCHLAALGSVPGSVAEPERYQDINTTGTFEVIDAARHARVQRMTFAASAAAYGDAPQLPKTETMAPSPKSPYAAQKLAGEYLLAAYAANYDIDTVSLRYFNVFGPRQNANSAYAAVISAFAKALIEQQTSPTIYGDGEQSRDFIHVDNVVHANLLALRASERLNGPVFNVACGGRISVNQLAITMAKLIGRPDLSPSHQPERAGDIKHSQADISAIRQALGFNPIVDFETGLAQTVAWYQDTADAIAP